MVRLVLSNLVALVASAAAASLPVNAQALNAPFSISPPPPRCNVEPCVAQIISNDVQMGKTKFPLPPSDYPAGLTGALWMDQLGILTPSNPKLPSTSADLLLSFGDPEFPLNRQERTINVDLSGPAWQWFNSDKGASEFVVSRNQLGFYRMSFDENYTHCDIVWCKHAPDMHTAHVTTAHPGQRPAHTHTAYHGPVVHSRSR